MLKFIPKSELQHRWNKLGQNMAESSLLVVYSARNIFRNADTEYTFRQDSNFWYLTGVDQNQSIFLLYKDDKDNLNTYIFSQPGIKEKEIWVGKRKTIDEIKDLSDADEVRVFEDFDGCLYDLVKQSKIVYLDPGNELEKEKIVELNPNCKIESFKDLMGSVRLYKSSWEMEQMKHAARVNTLAFSRVKETIKHYLDSKFTEVQPFLDSFSHSKLFEYQLEAELNYIYKQNGLEWSYPPIVAGGENATILHYNTNNQEIADNSLILIDAGCEYNYYASDITRTFILGDKMSDIQKAVYDLVKKSNLDVLQKLEEEFGTPSKPIELSDGGGVVEIRGTTDLTIYDLHMLGTKTLVSGLIDLNILSGSLDENLKNGDYKKYFMHGIGHWLGLDVHDLGGKLKVTKLRSGMAFTVEPGLYFDPEDENLPEELRGIGVRIEDDVIISDTGVEVLSDGVEK